MADVAPMKNERKRGETMTSSGEIFIVDDDPAVRDALSVVF
jgi:hypothetical protein